MASKKQGGRKAARRRHHQEKTRGQNTDPIPGAVAELRALQARSGRILEARHSSLSWLKRSVIRVRLDTSDIETSTRGLAVGDTEVVFVLLGDRYPNHPPKVLVDADPRFVGFPHVICARELCVYLDPRREWHPTFGMAELIDRIWLWFHEAASASFDARTSLFHAVGGCNPATEYELTSVIRASPPVEMPAVSKIALVERSASRLDLVGWRRVDRSKDEVRGLAFSVPSPLPLGLGNDVETLALQIERAGGLGVSEVIQCIRHAAGSSRTGQPMYLCLVVAHPTEADLPTVVVGRVGIDTANKLRARDPDLTTQQTRIGWMQISDDRPTVVVPRDNLRPTTAFRGASVEIWGCGGLGSWIAEFVVRAQPANLVVRDLAYVHRGLLVRQNYTELDVGETKVKQLAARLSSISDTARVSVGSLPVEDMLDRGSIPECDMIINATINEAVAYRLDQAARGTKDRPVLAQVATDTGSGTLGLVVVAGRDVAGGPSTVDLTIAQQVLTEALLEPYHTFWTPPSAGSELNPSPGCSVPTYHGSAADLAATAGSMVSLLGQQLAAPVSGGHVFAAPHSGVQPSFHFEPYKVTVRTATPD